MILVIICFALCMFGFISFTIEDIKLTIQRKKDLKKYRKSNIPEWILREEPFWATVCLMLAAIWAFIIF